jgi:hypothetical protein
VIIAGKERWHVEPDRLAVAHLPASLTGIIQARLDRLTMAERGTLQQASVVGRVFWDRAVAYVGEHDVGSGTASRVSTALDELGRREMIFLRSASSFQGSQEYIFKHAVLRQVAYDRIVKRLRQRYHSLTADWLLAQTGDRAGEHAGLIAEHLELAARNAEAALYLQAAAEGAASRYANEEAIQYYLRLLALREALAADLPGESVSVLLERLGDLYFWLTKHAQAREAYERAGAQPEAQDRLVQARLLRKRANSLRDGYGYEASLETYAEAEKALGETPIVASSGVDGAAPGTIAWWSEWMEIQLDRVQLYYWQARADDAFNLLVAIQPTVEQYGTPDQRTHYFLSLTANSFRRDRMAPSEASLGYLRLAKAAAAESAQARDLPSTTFQLGFFAFFGGELAAAEEYMATALRQATRTGDISLQSRCLTYLAIVYRLQGRDDEVETYSNHALEVAQAACMPEYTATAKANQAWLAWRRGDLEAAETYGREALAVWNDLPKQMASTMLRWTALWPLLGVALHRGLHATAIDCARAMLQPTQMRLPRELEALLENASAADEKNEADLALDLLRQAVASACRLGQL